MISKRESLQDWRLRFPFDWYPPYTPGETLTRFQLQGCIMTHLLIGHLRKEDPSQVPLDLGFSKERQGEITGEDMQSTIFCAFFYRVL